jgi:hypothetical protein
MKRSGLVVLTVAIGLTAGAAAPANDAREPTAKQAQELLSAVCKNQTGLGTDGSYCKPCPKFTSFADGLNEVFVLNTVLFGKFFNARQTQALLDFRGCEAHATNFGGTVILRWEGLTNWSFVRYEAGNRTSDCLKYRASDGHDLLVCRGYYANMGFEIQGFGVLNYARKAGDVNLVTLTSNGGQCMDPKFNRFEVQGVERRDLNRDGRSDLRVVVGESHYTAPKTFRCGDPVVWGPVRRLTLDFVFDGLNFKPTPSTAPLVKYLGGFRA